MLPLLVGTRRHRAGVAGAGAGGHPGLTDGRAASRRRPGRGRPRRAAAARRSRCCSCSAASRSWCWPTVLSRTGRGDATLLLGVGALAGALSFVGVLVGAVFWVPKVVSFAGRALARTGTSARLAAANTVRNPRRTAATSAALLIGVTLVAMMSTGAASARVSLAQELDEHYPVDLTVDGGVPDGDATLHAGRRRRRRRRGPASTTVLEMRTAPVKIGDELVHRGRAGRRLGRRTCWRPAHRGRAHGRHRCCCPKIQGEPASRRRPGRDGLRQQLGRLRARRQAARPCRCGRWPPTWAALYSLVTPATLDALDPHAPVSMVWVRLEPDADAALVLQDVRAALPDTAAEVSSAGAQRATYERVVDTLLAVVVGLLGVAVVIALIGVANTLSLSVLERRRESATLRAIGLSRRQLRWMLAVEGMLIAGVGAVLGAGLGLLYGWAGSVVAVRRRSATWSSSCRGWTWRSSSSSRSPPGCSPRCCRVGRPRAPRRWPRSPSTDGADGPAEPTGGPVGARRRVRLPPTDRPWARDPSASPAPGGAPTAGRVGRCGSPCSTPTLPAARACTATDVEADPGTALSALRPALSRVSGYGGWVGAGVRLAVADVPLDDHHVVGQPPLVEGCVLRVGAGPRPAAEVAALAPVARRRRRGTRLRRRARAPRRGRRRPSARGAGARMCWRSATRPSSSSTSADAASASGSGSGATRRVASLAARRRRADRERRTARPAPRTGDDRSSRARTDEPETARPTHHLAHVPWSGRWRSRSPCASRCCCWPGSRRRSSPSARPGLRAVATPPDRPRRPGAAGPRRARRGHDEGPVRRRRAGGRGAAVGPGRLARRRRSAPPRAARGPGRRPRGARHAPRGAAHRARAVTPTTGRGACGRPTVPGPGRAGRRRRPRATPRRSPAGGRRLPRPSAWCCWPRPPPTCRRGAARGSRWDRGRCSCGTPPDRRASVPHARGHRRARGRAGARRGRRPRGTRHAATRAAPCPTGRRWARSTASPRRTTSPPRGTRHARASSRCSASAPTGGTLAVDLVADGPHALVAGTTGAGKSELLTTLVLALALTHPPDRLAMLLVDFKGGTGLGPVAGLPHVLEHVTDLDATHARRVLTALRAELRRRERVLTAAGARDLLDLDPAAAGTPPRLLVVVDELRALTEDVPDASGALARIAAQGRALGVHLVLATQRPAGAVGADLRANVALRVALRVADVADSHGRPRRARRRPDRPRDARTRLAAPGHAAARAGAGRPRRRDERRAGGPSRPTRAGRRRLGAPQRRPRREADGRHRRAWVRAARRGRARGGRPGSDRRGCPRCRRGAAGDDVPDGPGLRARRRGPPRRSCAAAPCAGTRRHGHLLVLGGPRSGRSTTLLTPRVEALEHGLARARRRPARRRGRPAARRRPARRARERPRRRRRPRRRAPPRAARATPTGRSAAAPGRPPRPRARVARPARARRGRRPADRPVARRVRRAPRSPRAPTRARARCSTRAPSRTAWCCRCPTRRSTRSPACPPRWRDPPHRPAGPCTCTPAARSCARWRCPAPTASRHAATSARRPAARPRAARPRRAPGGRDRPLSGDRSWCRSAAAGTTPGSSRWTSRTGCSSPGHPAPAAPRRWPCWRARSCAPAARVLRLVDPSARDVPPASPASRTSRSSTWSRACRAASAPPVLLVDDLDELERGHPSLGELLAAAPRRRRVVATVTSAAAVAGLPRRPARAAAARRTLVLDVHDPASAELVGPHAAFCVDPRRPAAGPRRAADAAGTPCVVQVYAAPTRRDPRRRPP